MLLQNTQLNNLFSSISFHRRIIGGFNTEEDIEARASTIIPQKRYQKAIFLG
jgi:hypothetical protein